MTGRERRALGITLGLVVLLKAVFLVTYPLNVSGDGFTYFRMLVTRTSNLAHAGGYPFLVGLPLALPRAILVATRGAESALVTPAEGQRVGGAAVPPPTEDWEAKGRWLPVVAFYVHLANHLLDGLAILALFLLLRAVFGVAPAVLASLVYGLNPWNVQWATLSRPEQAQSDLLVIMLAVLYGARRAADPRRKTAGYAAGAAVFVLAVLVKFNAVLLVAIPVLLLALDPAPVRARLRLAGIALLTGLATYAGFLALYHAPSTGTWDLAYASGHNLYVRLERNPTPLFSPDNGLASRKLAVLTRVLPPAPASCCGVTLFTHVDWVGAAERRPYRERYGSLLETADAARVEEAYAAVRERPPGSIMSVHYYLGVAEGNRLLRATFLEAVWAEPGAHLAGAGRLFLRTFVQLPEPLVPVLAARLEADPPLYVLADEKNREPRGGGFVTLTTSAYRSRVLDYKGSPTLWLPGVAFVSGALVVTRVPTLALWLLAAAGAWLSLARVPAEEGTAADPGAARWGPALLLALLVLFFAGWSLLFDVRNKDVRFVQPLLDALVGVGVYRLARLRPRGWGRWRAWS